MLSYLIEKTVAGVSTTVDAISTVGNHIVDDIASIPQAVEDGWENGLFTQAEQDINEAETTKETDQL